MRTTSAKSSRVSIRRPHAVRKSKAQNAMSMLMFFGAIAIVGWFVLANAGGAPEVTPSGEAPAEQASEASTMADADQHYTELNDSADDFDYSEDFGLMPGDRHLNEYPPSRRLADGSPVPGDRL